MNHILIDYFYHIPCIIHSGLYGNQWHTFYYQQLIHNFLCILSIYFFLHIIRSYQCKKYIYH